MIQGQYNNFYRHFYIDSTGEHRRHAVFAPGLDRFILVDDKDFWLTLEAAEILSSKLPTIAYMLPPNAFTMTNDNCINYTIDDKRTQRIGPSAIVGGRQHPMLKFLYDKDMVAEVGIPEDYKDNTEILDRLLKYARFVQHQVYVLNITDAFYNFENTETFADKYVDDKCLQHISSRFDRSNFKKGLFFELRKILYLSHSPEEAEEKITDFWFNNYTDQTYLMLGYYKILGKPMPEKLVPLSRDIYKNISTMLF